MADYSMKYNIEYGSLNYAKIEKELQNITLKAQEFIKSFKTPIDKGFKAELVDAFQELNKINKERSMALENERKLTNNIKALENARTLAQKQGNKALADKLKNVSTTLQKERQANCALSSSVKSVFNNSKSIFFISSAFLEMILSFALILLFIPEFNALIGLKFFKPAPIPLVLKSSLILLTL